MKCEICYNELVAYFVEVDPESTETGIEYICPQDRICSFLKEHEISKELVNGNTRNY